MIRKQAEEAKMTYKAKKAFVDMAEGIIDTMNDPEFQQSVQDNGEKFVNAVSHYFYRAGGAVKDAVQDEENQEVVKGGMNSILSWGKYGGGLLWSSGKGIVSYGMDKYYGTEPEEKKELPEPKVTLQDYYISYMAWRTNPLHNSAKYIGGKHSKIYVIFKVKGIVTDWVLPEVAFGVERHQNGIFIAKKGDMKEKGTETLDCTLFEISTKVNLKDFLIKCVELDTGYQLDSKDCHCLARDLWGYCVGSGDGKKPNEWLTKIGKIANSKLPKGGPGGQRRIKIHLDPRKKEEGNILKELKEWDS